MSSFKNFKHTLDIAKNTIQKEINTLNSKFKITQQNFINNGGAEKFKSNLNLKIEKGFDFLMGQFRKAFHFLFSKDNTKRISHEDNTNNKNPLSVTKQIKTLTEYSKQTAIIILDKINSIVIKITFGYLDVKKVFSNNLIPLIKNFPQIIYKINLQNLIILYKIMGQKMSKTKNDLNNLIKKDPRFNDYKNSYENFFKNMEEQTTNKNSFYNRFMNKFKPHLPLLNSKLSNSLPKMNRFIKSPEMMKKAYSYKIRIMDFWKNKKLYYEYFTIDYWKGKNRSVSTYVRKFTFTDMKDFVFGGTKRKMKRILFYIISIIVFYYLAKYSIFRLSNRSKDRKLEETLKVVQDVKRQNEELMEYNRKLIDTIINSKKKD
jgi:hypothetical protein